MSRLIRTWPSGPAVVTVVSAVTAPFPLVRSLQPSAAPRVPARTAVLTRPGLPRGVPTGKRCIPTLPDSICLSRKRRLPGNCCHRSPRLLKRRCVPTVARRTVVVAAGVLHAGIPFVLSVSCAPAPTICRSAVLSIRINARPWPFRLMAVISQKSSRLSPSFVSPTSLVCLFSPPVPPGLASPPCGHLIGHPSPFSHGSPPLPDLALRVSSRFPPSCFSILVGSRGRNAISFHLPLSSQSAIVNGATSLAFLWVDADVRRRRAFLWLVAAALRPWAFRRLHAAVLRWTVLPWLKTIPLRRSLRRVAQHDDPPRG